MSEAASSEPTAPSLEGEDAARASWYGLIGRLFYAPPDPNLLAEISRSGEGGDAEGSDDGLAAAWRGLQAACRGAFPAVVQQEYDNLFVGAGRSEVSPYLSGYAEAIAPDRYLVRLREQLDSWGLARRAGAGEVEDHISGISDVMRWLIEDGKPLAEQQRFFEEFAYRGAERFCVAVQKSPTANFYKHVAALTSSFLSIEKAAFEMTQSS